MSQFRTIAPLTPSAFQIGYGDQIALMGSCFSGNIAAKLADRKLKVLSNPYGIVFNPISLFKSILEIIDQKEYDSSHLIFHNELQHSLNHHSEFSHPESSEVIQKINSNSIKARGFLQTAKVLYLTLGTAWVYSYDGEIVANCHKIPNHHFEKRLLSIEEIVDSFEPVIKRLNVFNPDLKIVFTLSPIRHLKDGFEENSLSKALLRSAISQLVGRGEQVSYFPAFEIMMDDLRDYRFYTKDMLHPSEQAVDYIWDKFCSRYMNANTLAIMGRVENLEAAKNHLPRFPNSAAHQKHKAFIQKEIAALKKFIQY
tara:strand:+ start:4295 stop:5230 length:936 start_codon:yes stop_codon:yes gene_type:complete